MKIEMLEQAMASYLKNVEGCDLVQTNWEPSEYQLSKISETDLAKVEQLVQDIKQVCPGLDIFKKNTLNQFLKQCEIDIVGVKNFNEIYLYDTAFHESGLNYKSTPETVAKKIIRAFIIAELLFKGLKTHVGFISPVVNKTPNNKISNIINIVSPILNSYNNNASIELIFNSTCYDMIELLIQNADAIASNNDLFIRSIKLGNLVEQEIHKTAKPAQPQAVSTFIAKSNNRSVVFKAVDSLINSGKLDTKLVSDLEDKQYCKKVFDLNYPFLAQINAISPKDQCRFYTKLFMINGRSYKVVSQWYPKQLKLLDDWLKTI